MPSVPDLLLRPLRRIVAAITHLEYRLRAFIRRIPAHRRLARFSGIVLFGCMSVVLMGSGGFLGCPEVDTIYGGNVVDATVLGLFRGLVGVPFGNSRKSAVHPQITGTDGSTTGIASFLGNFTGIGQSAPNYFVLLRQPDCSLSLVTGTSSLNGSMTFTGATPHYEQVMHQLASLNTTPDVFPKGCSDPHLGISSRIGVFAGLTTGGTLVAATATGNGNANAVFVLTTDSALASANLIPITSLPSATALATADLNGDGNGDLVVVNQAAQTAFISVTLGSASGTFGTPVNYPIAGSTSAAAVIDDVNNDGKLDIVAVSSDQQISVLLGNGDGTFQAAQSFAAPALPGYPSSSNTPILGLITADVNGDGNKDIVGNNGLVLLGNGKGGFTPLATPAFPFPSQSNNTPSGFGPGLAAGDVNNDGHTDLVVDTGTTISIYLGNGAGAFTPATSYASINNSGYVTLTDLDGDGNLDIYTGLADGALFTGDDTNNSEAYFLMGNGDGSFVGATNVPIGGYNGTNLGDINGDGVPDLVTLTPTNNFAINTLPFVAQLGTGKGGFAVASTINPPSTYVVNGVTIVSSYVVGGATIDATPNPTTYAVGDVNGDGNADLVFVTNDALTLNPYTNQPESYPYPILFVALSNGDGTFKTPVPSAIATPLNGGSQPPPIVGLQIADLNQDGKKDLILTVSGYGYLGGVNQAYEAFMVLLGNGDGTFSSKPVFNSILPSSGIPDSTFLPTVLNVVDLNGDGIPDLVAANPNSNLASIGSTVETFLGNGDGTFKTPVPIVAAPEFGVPAVADFNKDGKLDIAFIAETGPQGQAEIVVALGNGDGTFATPSVMNITGGDAVRGATLAAADFNGDGTIDLALIDSLDFSGVFYGKGDGTFSSVPQSGYVIPKDLLIVSASGTGSSAGIAVDLNKDGKPDLLADNTVFLNLYGAAPQVLAGTTTALTASASSIDTGSSVTFTATVAPPAGSTTAPTGTVTFFDGTTSLGTGTLNGSGVATLTTTALTIGTHSVTATYSGDANFNGSTSSAVTVTVTALPTVSTSTALVASANPAVSGTSITFTATVQAASGSVTPYGLVTFTDGSTELGRVTLNASAVATFTTSSLAVGSHSIVAEYGGVTGGPTGSFTGSTSSALAVTITAAPPPSFTLGLSPTTGTVTAGSSASTTLTLTPQNGFAQATNLTCSGAPTGSTCSINPASVTPASSAPVTAAVTLQTSATSASVRHGMPDRTLAAVLPAGSLMAFVCFLLPEKRRRRFRIGLYPVILLCFVGALTSCSRSQGTPAQTTSTANLTVTATSGTLVQTASWAVTIE